MVLDDLQLNVPLLKERVSNLTAAARGAGLRAATVSNLCTGKIPIGRAEVRTLAILSSLAGCTMDELVLRTSSRGMVETGVKVIDLLAPIARGGVAGLVARPGTGQLVLLAELFRRLKTRGYVPMLWRPLHDCPGMEEAAQEANEVCSSIEELIERADTLRQSHDVVIGADREVVLTGELAQLREKLKAAGARAITFILIDARGESPDIDVPYGPLDTLLRFDLELGSRNLFPAIDPISSTSVLLEGSHLEAIHIEIGSQARRLLRRYREQRPLVMARGVELMTGNDQMVYARGERLEAFLTQPFYTAEPFTQRQGQWVSLFEMLEDVRFILDGKADRFTPEELAYIGRLKGGASNGHS